MLKIFATNLQKAAQTFTSTKATTHAAAIAFFAIFSLAPLVMFAVGIAGIFVGRAAASEEIIHLLQSALGQDVAEYVVRIAETAATRTSSATFTIISIGTLLVGATAIFNQLTVALDDIWEVEPDNEGLASGILNALRRRTMAFVMILIGSAALIASVALDVVLSQVGHFLEAWLPGISTLQSTLNWIITPIIGFLVFMLMFKLLPETRPGWQEATAGAALTTLLFLGGTVVIGFYLGHSGTISLYGAAGSLIVLLLWIYYSSWIVLFGAAFTHALGEELHQDASLVAEAGMESSPPKTTI
ncbi:MAG: YihY/virulence factor BrkB family protein [Chloroflexota bacterium]